jgi:hypothetical protein
MKEYESQESTPQHAAEPVVAYGNAQQQSPRVLSEELRNKIAFTTFIIEEFASAYKKDRQESYLYLEEYGGLDYIDENWWALHIDNPFWVLRELFDLCKRNGGYMR